MTHGVKMIEWSGTPAYQQVAEDLRKRIASDEFAPVRGYVFNAKLLGNALGMFTMAAGDGDYPRALTILKAGDLRGTSKSGADNSNADDLFFIHLGFDSGQEFITPRFPGCKLATGGRQTRKSTKDQPSFLVLFHTARVDPGLFKLLS